MAYFPTLIAVVGPNMIWDVAKTINSPRNTVGSQAWNPYNPVRAELQWGVYCFRLTSNRKFHLIEDFEVNIQLEDGEWSGPGRLNSTYAGAISVDQYHDDIYTKFANTSVL